MLNLEDKSYTVKLLSFNLSKRISSLLKAMNTSLIFCSEHPFLMHKPNKCSSFLKVKLAIKLFPILNNKVYFVGLIAKENIENDLLVFGSIILKIAKVVFSLNSFFSSSVKF